MNAHPVGPTPRVSGSRRSIWLSDGRRIFLLLAVFVLVVGGWIAGELEFPIPHFRFTAPALNTWSFLVALSFAWFAFFTALNSTEFKRAWARRLLVGALVPVLLLTIPAAILTLAPSWSTVEVVKSIRMDGYEVVLHRHNCGVPCDFWIDVEQQRVLISPLMVSQRLDVLDPAGDARVEVVGKNALRITIDPEEEPGVRERRRVYHLKPYFLF